MKKLLNTFTAFLFTLSVMLSGVTAHAAGNFNSSVIATGTQKLIQDVTTWMLIIAPIITVLLIIYYLIRKGMAEEMEHKKWNSRCITAIICCIGAVLASVILNMLIGYFQ